jgi:acetyl esterase/lipase
MQRVKRPVHDERDDRDQDGKQIFMLANVLISSAVMRAPILFAMTAISLAAQVPQDGQVLPLWSGQAPSAQGSEDRDTPTLTVYWPRTMREGTSAVIVCPGGGYAALASNHEGRQVASFLNSLGMAAFVLKYRLGPRYHHPVEIGDAQRALRTVRAKAAEWKIAPDRIGIMGFSAGGHLASSVSTHFDTGNASASDPIDRAGSRPDFSILGYPVISMTQPWTHQGSKKNLLGDNPDPALAKSLSGEEAVTAQTPPTFIFQTNADTTVPAENSVYYYLALRKAGVKAEMHIFQNGPHGVGLGMDDPALSEWPGLLAHWLRVNGFVK